MQNWILAEYNRRTTVCGFQLQLARFSGSVRGNPEGGGLLQRERQRRSSSESIDNPMTVHAPWALDPSLSRAAERPPGNSTVLLFYGCSYMHHLGNNRRDSHFMAS